MYSGLSIKDQGKTDFCLGCAISTIAEYLIGEPCEECYSFAAGKKYSGQGLSVYGIPPKSALLGAIQSGVLPKRFSPYSIASNDRNFLANWDNWSSLESNVVRPFGSFKKVSISEIDLYLKKGPLIVGLYWQQDWSTSPVINIDNKSNWNKMSPHEAVIIGKEDGYLIIQNSRGSEKGLNGLWHLPEEAFDMISHIYALSPEPWANKLVELINKYL